MNKVSNYGFFKSILLAALLLMLGGCSDSNDQLLEKIKAAVMAEGTTAEGYKVVSMEELTDFEWDRMYFFNAGQNSADISSEIGFAWVGDQVPELNRRLLFVQGEQVVSYVDYNYNEFPLFVYGCNQDRWVYPRSRAQFATFKYCSNDLEIYAFIPEPCINNIREFMNYQCPEGVASE
ncbi:MAG: hypothetical protein LPK07_16170 [Hymenobacteraceae bacterium]|nr:hypothetical protein [Hymenobacteraceae bacterium]